MSKKAATLTVLLLMLAGLLCSGGCANLKQAPLEIRYYTIEYDPPPPVDGEPEPCVIKIDRFQTSPLYDSNRIVFKSGEFMRDEYIYHKWRAHPGELVSFFLARDFSETGRFRATLHSDSISPYTHLITGAVEDFYQQRSGQSGEAVLTVAVTLIDNTRPVKGSPVLMQKKYRLREKTGDGGPPDLAKAMSNAMQQVSENILKDVYSLLEK